MHTTDCVRSTATTTNSSSSSNSSSSNQSSEQSYRMLGAHSTASVMRQPASSLNFTQLSLRRFSMRNFTLYLSFQLTGGAALLAGILAVIEAAKTEEHNLLLVVYVHMLYALTTAIDKLTAPAAVAAHAPCLNDETACTQEACM
jgi:hypothetical protein